MGRKISQFPAASTINDADVLAGVQSTSNKKFSFALIKSWFQGQFIPTSAKGAVNGVAELDAGGKVPSSQLPTMPSNVEANPSGAATDTLTKLQVDQTIYAVSGGGVVYLTVVDGKICVIYEV